jgi:hypothetical protein
MDVIEGFVSLEKAKSEYGVVLKKSPNQIDFEVDKEETLKLREKMRKME